MVATSMQSFIAETLWLPFGKERRTLDERGGVPEQRQIRGLSVAGQSRTMRCAVGRSFTR